MKNINPLFGCTQEQTLDIMISFEINKEWAIIDFMHKCNSGWTDKETASTLVIQYYNYYFKLIP